MTKKTYDSLAATGFRLGTAEGIDFMRGEKKDIVAKHGAGVYADLEKAVLKNDEEAAGRFARAVAPGLVWQTEIKGADVVIAYDGPVRGNYKMRTVHGAVALASLACSVHMTLARKARATAAAEAAGYEILLANVGNPDFRQDPDRPLPETSSGEWRPVSSWADASKIAREYIEEHELGGGNWSGGEVRDYFTKEVVGRVSYNGRTWPFEGVASSLPEDDEPADGPRI